MSRRSKQRKLPPGWRPDGVWERVTKGLSQAQIREAQRAGAVGFPRAQEEIKSEDRPLIELVRDAACAGRTFVQLTQRFELLRPVLTHRQRERRLRKMLTQCSQLLSALGALAIAARGLVDEYRAGEPKHEEAER